MALPKQLIVIYLGESVLLPSAIIQVALRGWDAKRLIQEHFSAQGKENRQTMQLACIPVTRSIHVPGGTTDYGLFPASEEVYLYTHGCTGRIVRVERPEDDGDVYHVLIEGLARFKVHSTERNEEGVLTAQIRYMTNRSARSEEAMHEFVELARCFVDTIEQLGMPESLVEELKKATSRNQPVPVIADLLMSLVDASFQEKLTMLSTAIVSDRIALASRCVTRQLQVLRIGQFHSFHLERILTKRQRRFYLRQQLERVQKELRVIQSKSEESNFGEEDDGNGLAELKHRIADARLPDDVLQVVEQEINRLDKLPTTSPEWGILRNYLDVVSDLPWRSERKDVLDLSIVKRQLDRDHFGLTQPKKRIIEYLSVAKMKGDLKPPILCFIGPPGVGKTSLGQSIAHALARKYHRISLGGIKDEAEMRGHRRTYLGAMPGLIIQGIRKCGVNNPVMLLDEVDKLARSARGDPAAALLEILDPKQNSTFHDHYLNFAYDLSKVLFIATANTLDTIPRPLLDRMEIIHLHSYTFEEKSHIARAHLIPKQLACHGLATAHFELSDGALARIIELYTRESGVRTLERMLTSVIRAKCVELTQMQEDHIEHQYIPQVTQRSLSKILGIPLFDKVETERQPMPGVVASLACSSSGNGEIVIVESIKIPAGKGRLELTGSLSGVFKESAQIALSWVKIHARYLKITQPGENIFAHHDIHIHVPQGAVPKIGPSAGIAMVCSLVSLFSGIPVMPTTAMTGEISLRGLILPVGSIKEKVVSAHRAGIRKIILPELNRKDVEADVPASVKMDIQFLYITTIWDAVESAVLTPEKAYRPLESHL